MSVNALALTPSPSASILDPIGYTQTSFLHTSAAPPRRRFESISQSDNVESPAFSQLRVGQNSDQLADFFGSSSIEGSPDDAANASQPEITGVPSTSDFQMAVEDTALDAGGGHIEFGKRTFSKIPINLYFKKDVLALANHLTRTRETIDGRGGVYSLTTDGFYRLHKFYLDYVCALAVELLSPQLAEGFRAARMLDSPSIAAAQKLGNLVLSDRKRDVRQRSIDMVKLFNTGNDALMIHRFLTSEGIDLPSDTLNITLFRKMLVTWSYGYLNSYTRNGRYLKDSHSFPHPSNRLEWRSEVISAARWYVEVDQARRPGTLPDFQYRQKPIDPVLLRDLFKLSDPAKLLPLVDLRRHHGMLREKWHEFLRLAGIRTDLANLDPILAKKAMLNTRRGLMLAQQSVDPKLRDIARWVETGGSRGDLAIIRLMNTYIVTATELKLQDSIVHTPAFKAMHGTAGFAFFVFSAIAATWNLRAGWTQNTAEGAIRMAAAGCYAVGNLARMLGYSIMAKYTAMYALKDMKFRGNVIETSFQITEVYAEWHKGGVPAWLHGLLLTKVRRF